MGCRDFIVAIAGACCAACSYHPRSLDQGDDEATDAASIDARRTDADPLAPDADPTADAAPIDASPPDAAPPCPSGYSERVPGSCYRIDNTARTWQAAEADCEADGAHLAVIDSLDEDAYVPDNRWLGFSEIITPGTFLWVTGVTSAYTGWATGEPGSLGGASCAEARGDGWHDDNCPELKPYACEYDGLPADPATF